MEENLLNFCILQGAKEGKMNYYAIYDAKSGALLAEGTARECRRKLGCAKCVRQF